MTATIVSVPSSILPLDSDQATLPLAGGKGANLARLARAGFPVPDGFLVTTEAYRAFVAANGLAGPIREALAHASPAAPTSYEDASLTIRGLFAGGRIPPDLAAGFTAAYAQLGTPPVAVRSSATAEDLPEMSFAGQQDTYLNVIGDEQLLAAVVNCWSSLWTARAISYRARNNVPQDEVALAVVVQKMVESRASGVLFTADPVTGLRTVTVIDATVGLGEALVSGQVEPDHYVVDALTGQIASRSLGAKAVSVRGRPGGGTSVVQEVAAGPIQALPDAQIRDLAALGQKVAGLYGSPQDVEWAWADGVLYLLQARPVTSLFPVPDGMPPEPLKVMISLAAIQGLLEPITPLGRDMFCEIFATGASLFGLRLTRQTQTVLHLAGERLWINVTSVVRNPLGRKIMPAALGMIEPCARQAVLAIWDDPRLRPERKRVRLRTALRLARFAIPVAGNALLNVLFPDVRRRAIVGQGERILERAAARCAPVEGAARSRLARLAPLIPKVIGGHLPRAFPPFISGVVVGMASLNLLNTLAETVPSAAPSGPRQTWQDSVLQITRGMPHNPTTEMDLTLWRIAQAIRRDPLSLAAFHGASAAELAACYQAGTLPAVAQDACADFLSKYGARGFGEIDTGRPRWSEDPAHVFEVLTGYLRIEDSDQAPDAVFARGAVSAQAAIDRLAAALRTGRRGRIKARLARAAAARARAWLGARESPKFFAVRLLAIIRRELLVIGRELAQAGELEQPDDLFYLSLSELPAFAAREPADWRGTIAQRREAYRRELLRRQVPHLLLSDGRAFYEGIDAPADAGSALAGSPVSPGVVEGSVRVVFDPRHAGLLPGEILICPGTDPSWTPLFLTAGGLVMEVGGMMTHGAVVAREYGIPAVVGVNQVTTRLHTGQRVRVDGSSGVVVILEEGESEG